MRLFSNKLFNPKQVRAMRKELEAQRLSNRQLSDALTKVRGGSGSVRRGRDVTTLSLKCMYGVPLTNFWTRLH